MLLEKRLRETSSTQACHKPSVCKENASSETHNEAKCNKTRYAYLRLHSLWFLNFKGLIGGSLVFKQSIK